MSSCRYAGTFLMKSWLECLVTLLSKQNQLSLCIFRNLLLNRRSKAFSGELCFRKINIKRLQLDSGRETRHAVGTTRTPRIIDVRSLFLKLTLFYFLFIIDCGSQTIVIPPKLSFQPKLEHLII